MKLIWHHMQELEPGGFILASFPNLEKDERAKKFC